MKNFTKMFLAACLITGLAFSVNAQSVGINSTGDAPNSSAGLDVNFTNKGFLPPRLTSTQIGAIVSPADGLMVYNTTNGKLYIYVSASLMWKEVTFGAGFITPPFVVCGSSFADPRDGKVYTTVLIGTQCWMAQNLNVGTRIIGENQQTNDSEIEKYCYWDDDEYCTTYGGLYQWAEIVQYLNGATNTTSWNPVPTGNVQGICPTGWHLPSDTEWTTLTAYLGGENGAGGAMKETGTTHWVFPNAGATNTSGFTGLAGGYRNFTSVIFSDSRYKGYFWSSTQNTTSTAWFRSLDYNNANVYWSYGTKEYGWSVRCLKD